MKVRKNTSSARRAAARVRFATGCECPECGEQEYIGSNGETGSDRTYCCEGCGNQWMADDYA